MEKTAVIVLYVLLVGLMGADQAHADGQKVCHTQYGGGVICETPEEIHEVADTGIVENMMLAGGLFAAGYVVMIAAQKHSLR